MRIARSKFSRLGEQDVIELLPETQVDYRPRLGTVIHDNHCDSLVSRPYLPFTANFNKVCLYSIENALVTSEFIVHRKNEVFVDSSILTEFGFGRDEETILQRMSADLDAAADEQDLRYEHETVLIAHNEGGGTWGHFLIQNYPKILFFLRAYPDAKVGLPWQYISLTHISYHNLFALQGVDWGRFIPIERDRTYKFARVLLMDFLYEFKTGMMHPRALELMENIPPTDSLDAGAFYVVRNGHSRLVDNNEDVIEVVESFGIPSIELGSSSLQEQINCWATSDLVIATLGSDLSNLVFGAKGSKVLAVSPHWFGDDFFYKLAIAKDMQWNELRCGKMGSRVEHDLKSSSFSINTSYLSAMIQGLR